MTHLKPKMTKIWQKFFVHNLFQLPLDGAFRLGRRLSPVVKFSRPRTHPRCVGGEADGRKDNAQELQGVNARLAHWTVDVGAEQSTFW